jgi:calcineurin-like phosphoesterase family protein
VRSNPDWSVDRRDFLRASAATVVGLAASGVRVAGDAASTAPGVRFGLIADAHYADADTKGTRFYRESIVKVREAVTRLRAERLSFLCELGDLKDMAADEPDSRTRAHLRAIEAEVRRFGGPTCHVLGNHDMDNLSKAQFLDGITNTGLAPRRAYYAFERGGVRFVTLDACCMKNGRDYDHGNFDWRDTIVPPAQLEWLRRELSSSANPVIVFVHQRLDGDGDAFVKNSAEVRSVLEASGRVLAAFHGHDHPGARSESNGIHYYTLKAIVEGSGPENNAYAVVEVDTNLHIKVTGYRRALSADMAGRRSTIGVVATPEWL